MNKKIILILCSLGLCAFLLSACDDVSTALKTPVYDTKLPKNEVQNTAFKDQFPLQYESYLNNNQSTEMSVYKGSVPYHKNDDVNPLPKGYKYAQPYLKNLWLGYPFMYEYNETRGHTNAVNDFSVIDRINRYAVKGGLPATCWNCKLTTIPELEEEYGDAFWAMDVNEFRTRVDSVENTIGCANCHNPENMELVITSIPLKDWLERSGKDVNNLSRNEMRSLVCAQCHVEYYFTDPGQGVSKKPVFPWDNGYGPEEIYQYYRSHGDTTTPGFEGQFVDWTHAASKTPMIKIQHPDYEMWIDGPHGSAGVTCADCHMPYTMGTNGQKFSSHLWRSPLLDDMKACQQCHSDKTADYLKSRVIYVQERTFEQLLVAQEISVKSHEAVRLADLWQGEKPTNYNELIIQAKDMVRKGQLFWDYVSAENGVGFHNPTKSLDTLAKSMQFSQEAINLAMEATNYGIAPTIQQDIKTLVPPILEFNRKLQQDPEYLKTNPWLEILPVLPEGDLVWDGLKMVNAQ